MAFDASKSAGSTWAAMRDVSARAERLSLEFVADPDTPSPVMVLWSPAVGPKQQVGIHGRMRSGTRPVFNPQSVDPAKLSRIVGHQNDVQRCRVSPN
jgi:hypothetical protein